MNAVSQRIPPGPTEKFDSADDLLQWIVAHRDRYGDIYQASVYGSRVYVISAPEYAEHVLLRNWRNYARKGQVVRRIALLLGNGLIASNGDFWASQRRMIQPAFTRPAIGALMPVIVDANTRLLARWEDAARSGSAVNVTRDVSDMVLEITLRSIFGDDYEAAARPFAVLAEDPARDMQFAQAFRQLGELIIELAVRRRREGRPGADILGTMIQARDRDRGEPMSDAQLAKEAMTLIVAGHETTSTALNWTWYLLARYPDVEARLARELDACAEGDLPPLSDFARFPYTEHVIEEALRSYPPLWLMTRHALQDDQLGDYFVPAGTEIYISPYLIQRNPALWPTPDAFDPARFEPTQVDARHKLSTCPFGAGPRNCIGEFLARTEMQAHLMTVVPKLKLCYEDPRPAGVLAGMNLLSEHDFFMIPELRTGVANPQSANS
jgi:cytochrome P450